MWARPLLRGGAGVGTRTCSPLLRWVPGTLAPRWVLRLGLTPGAGAKGLHCSWGNACADQQKWGEVREDEGGAVLGRLGRWSRGASSAAACRQPGALHPPAEPPCQALTWECGNPPALGSWECARGVSGSGQASCAGSGKDRWWEPPRQGTERLGGGACQGRDLEPGDQGVWTSLQDLCGAEGGFGAG